MEVVELAAAGGAGARADEEVLPAPVAPPPPLVAVVDADLSDSEAEAGGSGDGEETGAPSVSGAKRPRKEVDAAVVAAARRTRFPTFASTMSWVDTSKASTDRYILTGEVLCTVCNKWLAVDASTGNLRMHSGRQTYVIPHGSWLASRVRCQTSSRPTLQAH